jgi:pimeloyl-ACP methyl ester carboxylesterase
MRLEPVRFGAAGRQLAGVHHRPDDAAALGHGALLCNPFGQEAIRCHRLMKVLADRLARAGLDVLRFDYFATGDSDGDDVEGTWEQWIEDVQHAREELVRASGVAGTSWFGLRLGATLAMLASSRGRGGPERLVLLDPVVSGAAYLEELAQAHAARLHAIAVPGGPPPAGGPEALGFPLAPGVTGPLSRLVPADFAAARAARVHLVASPGAEGVEALERVLRAGPAAVATTRIASRVTWASDEAMNSAIVPADALQAAVAAFTEGP